MSNTRNHDIDECMQLMSHPRVKQFLRAISSDVSFRFVGTIPPRRAYRGDAGLDIALQETVTVYPGDTAYIPSGIACDIPEGLCVEVKTRSSTFKRHVVVTPTIVDHNYKNEISTIVTNNNSYPVTLERGMYIAQAVIHPYFTFDNEFVDESGQVREGKFGSSGQSFVS